METKETAPKIDYIRLEACEPKINEWLNPEIWAQLRTQNPSAQIDPENLILGVITHSFANTPLPIELDTVFSGKDIDQAVSTQVTIRGCFNFGQKFHTELWQGHNHLTVLEFPEGIPPILQNLTSLKEWKRWDPNYILCSSRVVKACQQQLKASIATFEAFMKEKNPHIWAANQKEEREYKEQNP